MRISDRRRWHLLVVFYSRKDDITPQEYIRYLAYRIRDFEEECRGILDDGGSPSAYTSFLLSSVHTLNVSMYHAKQMRDICEGKNT
jgi:hypothetical protein